MDESYDMLIISQSSCFKPGVNKKYEKPDFCLKKVNINCCFYKAHFFCFSSVAQWCLTLCDPVDCSMLGLPVHHQLLEFTQTHVHSVGDAIQPSHPLSSPSPPAPNLSQHQGFFKSVSSSHQVPKVLELQLYHQSFQ